MTQSYFADVQSFHDKFGLPHAGDPEPPAPLTPDVLSFRIAFMLEELAEFCRSQGAYQTASQLTATMKELREFADEVKDAPKPPTIAGLADGGDALVDLVYVALGTAHLMRLPFEAMWTEVQRANLEKERAQAGDPRSKRGHRLDVVKPVGWRGPDHWPLIYAKAIDPTGQLTYRPHTFDIYEEPIIGPTIEQRTDGMITEQPLVRRLDLCYCSGRQGHDRGSPGCLHEVKVAVADPKFVCLCGHPERGAHYKGEPTWCAFYHEGHHQ